MDCKNPAPRFLLPVRPSAQTDECARQRGPIVLTPAELALYNGTDPTLPIYVAVNGTVYDVSAGRDSYYGPGGSYSFFAGRDGARAFVTGCFSPEHVVPDLAGAEEVFLPQTGPVSAAVRISALSA